MVFAPSASPQRGGDDADGAAAAAREGRDELLSQDEGSMLMLLVRVMSWASMSWLAQEGATRAGDGEEAILASVKYNCSYFP